MVCLIRKVGVFRQADSSGAAWERKRKSIKLRLTSPKGRLEAVLVAEARGEEEVQDAAETRECEREPERHGELLASEPLRAELVL